MSGQTAPRPDVLAYPLLAAHAALLGGVTWVQNSATRQYLWPWFLAVQFVYWLPILGWLWRAARSQTSLAFRLAPDAALSALVVGGVLAAAFSPFRWLSLTLLVPYLATVAVGWSVRSWLFSQAETQEVRLTILRNVLAGFFTLHSSLSLGQWLIFHVFPSWIASGGLTDLPRNEFPFGHSTYVAGFAVLSLPWLAFTAWKAEGKLRCVWIMGAAATILLIPSTSSRGGVIGAGVLAMLSVTVLFVRGRLTPRARRLVGLGAALGLVVMVFLNPRLRDLVIHGRWNAISDASNAQRSAMTEAGILMGKDRPLTGWGPGVVPLTYPHYRARLSGGVENVLQLHNTPVQLWAEMGWIGIFAFLMLLTGALIAFIRMLKVRREKLSASEEFSLLCSIALLAYFATSVTDFQWDVPAFACVLGCYLAGLDGQKSREAIHGGSRGWSILVLSIWTSTTGLVLWSLIPFARAREQGIFAWNGLERGDKTAFVQTLTRTSELLPQNPLPVNQIAAYLIEERAKSGDPATRGMLAFNIFQCFNASLRRDQAQEYVHFNYGWLLLEGGQPGAAEHFRTAARLVPDKGGVYLGLALALQQEGKSSEASAALALECLNDPTFLASPWWQVPALSQARNETGRRLQHDYSLIIEKVDSGSPLSQELHYQQQLASWFFGTAAPGELVALSLGSMRKQFWQQVTQTPNSSRFSTAAIRSYRRERTGYPVLMRTPEMKPPIDLYQVQDNELAVNELAYLFAPKGWLPAPLWLELIGETSSSH